MPNMQLDNDVLWDDYDKELITEGSITQEVPRSIKEAATLSLKM